MVDALTRRPPVWRRAPVESLLVEGGEKTLDIREDRNKSFPVLRELVLGGQRRNRLVGGCWAKVVVVHQSASISGNRE
jgi:hypothetical protein